MAQNTSQFNRIRQKKVNAVVLDFKLWSVFHFTLNIHPYFSRLFLTGESLCVRKKFLLKAVKFAASNCQI